MLSIVKNFGALYDIHTITGTWILIVSIIVLIFSALLILRFVMPIRAPRHESQVEAMLEQPNERPLPREVQALANAD